MNTNQGTTATGNENLIAYVFCSGDAAGKERLAHCNSCKEAVESGFERGECKNGCVGIGDCVNVCTRGAMSVVDGKIVIDADKCDGCGECAEKNACPQNIIRMIPRDATNFIPCSSTEEDDQKTREICGYGCIACSDCVRACPQNAIEIVDNHAVIDYDKCVGCDACVVKCKKKIIVDTMHDLTKLKENVAFVRCSGGYVPNQKYTELGYTSCHDVAKKINPKDYNLCTTSCIGMGDCTRVCRYGAIEIVGGTALVDPEKCVGCKDCTYECPREIISIMPYKGSKFVACSSTDDYEDKAAVCSASCIACQDCVNNCPTGAMYMDGNHAVVDESLCADCNMCQYVCTRFVIHGLKVPESNYMQRDALRVTEGE